MGEMEPEELWVPQGRTWKAKAPELRFPTFTRPIARRRPPPSPAGLEGSSDEAKFRWAHDQFKFPPYTYEEKYLLEDQEGRFYKLPAVSRETLMGFAHGHTLRLDRELFKKTNLAEAEDIRQAALGNSFHTGTLASLLGAILFHKGFLPSVKSPKDLMTDLVAEAHQRKQQPQRFADPPSGDEGPAEELSEQGWEDEDLLQLQEEPQEDLDDARVHGKLMSALVGQFLRKVELRGSDIRLDANVIYKPGTCPRCSIDPRKWKWKHGRAFRWKAPAHINLLELRAALAAIQWRGRRRKYHSVRTLILLDSQAALAVLTKGRSSSKAVNRILRRVCALTLALNTYLLGGWIDTAENPADEASRLFDDDR
eukprot:s889_g18.t1